MTWQEVETDIGPKVGRVKYSVTLKHGGARVSVPKHVAEALGWKKDASLKLLVGGGEQEGKLRLEPAANGRLTMRTSVGKASTVFQVRLGRWSALAQRDVDSVAVEHVIDGKALVLALPRHALMVAPTISVGKSLATVSTENPLGAPNGKVDVSDRFFNDPKKPIGMASGTRTGR